MVFFQTVYDTWFITFYNLVYTSLPVLGLSLFDQVRPATNLLVKAEAPGPLKSIPRNEEDSSSQEIGSKVKSK